MNEYEVEIGGLTHTVLLSADDAERYGDLAKPVGGAKTPTRKRRAPNKSRVAKSNVDAPVGDPDLVDPVRLKPTVTDTK